MWLKNFHSQDYLPLVEVPLESLKWLSRVRIENLLTYALLCYLSWFLRANICSLFPCNKQIIDEWFTLSLKGKQEKALKIKNVSREGLNCSSRYISAFLCHHQMSITKFFSCYIARKRQKHNRKRYHPAEGGALQRFQ